MVAAAGAPTPALYAKARLELTMRACVHKADTESGTESTHAAVSAEQAVEQLVRCAVLFEWKKYAREKVKATHVDSRGGWAGLTEAVLQFLAFLCRTFGVSLGVLRRCRLRVLTTCLEQSLPGMFDVSRLTEVWCASWRTSDSDSGAEFRELTANALADQATLATRIRTAIELHLSDHRRWRPQIAQLVRLYVCVSADGEAAAQGRLKHALTRSAGAIVKLSLSLLDRFIELQQPSASVTTERVDELIDTMGDELRDDAVSFGQSGFAELAAPMLMMYYSAIISAIGQHDGLVQCGKAKWQFSSVLKLSSLHEAIGAMREPAYSDLAQMQVDSARLFAPFFEAWVKGRAAEISDWTSAAFQRDKAGGFTVVPGEVHSASVTDTIVICNTALHLLLAQPCSAKAVSAPVPKRRKRTSNLRQKRTGLTPARP
jgi:hypothetical protein